MFRCAITLLFVLAGHLFGGGASCVPCHPAETRLHEQTKMAHAMLPALESGFARHADDHPLHEALGGFAYSYAPVPGGLAVTSERGSQSATGVIEWVLGAGSQGQTPLVRFGKAIFESRVSYFPRLNQYGITIGQEAGASANAVAALGFRQSEREAVACIGCHSTGGVTKPLEPVVPGVQCERCHAGSEDHALHHTAIVNPGKLAAREQVELCGTCHRIKAPVDDFQLENVRFQPLRLIKSQCFTSGKLECTTCHVAHQDARRNDAAFYNQKCVACHLAAGALRHVDARQTGDCIGCHMPVVELHPALRFTDHFIRVVKN